MKISKGEKVFKAVIAAMVGLIALITLYPLWYVFAASISNAADVLSGDVLFWPKHINFQAYTIVFRQEGLLTAYANTIFYTLAGTAASLLITVPGAYALSKKRLTGRKFLMVFVSLTMWINAGIIPTYLNMKNLHLLDNRWGIVIGFAVSAFYVILMRSFFEGVPEALEESAKLDGADDIRIMWQIYMPLSTPALMTIMLYYAIDRWNGYFWTMILIKDESKISLQVLLTKLIITLQGYEETMGMIDTAAYSNQTLVYATIVVSVVPILLVYPYIQIYFVSGMTLGAVKG